MTRAEFVGAMAPLSVNYNRELTRALMTVYWTEFQHLLADEFRDAITYHIRHGKFFPTVAELRQVLGMDAAPTLADASAVFEQLLGPAPAYDPKRGDYWTLEAVQQRFGTQGLAAFMAAGGTRVFRDRTDKDLPFLRRDFIRGWEEAGRTLPEARYQLPTTPAPRGLAPAGESVPRLLESFERGDAWEPPDTSTTGEQ